jgi:hypothetical protein
MRTHVTALVLALAAAAGLYGQPPYTDPKGRFTVRIPAGWSATQLNADAVSFGSGNAFSTLMVLAGANPQAIIRSVLQQYAPQWKNFVEARRGDTKFAGRTGPYVTYSGVNPKGLDSFLQILGATDGAFTYLLTSTAPKTEFAKMKPGFDQIEQSFTLREAKPSPMGTPAPGPAATPPHPAAPAQPTAPAAMPAGRGAPAAAGNQNYYRMKKVSVIDEHGFERPIPALSLLIPADWQFQGAAVYGKAVGCKANLVRLNFRAVSPDGRYAIELFPGQTWQWSDDQNAVRMMQMSNQQTAQYGGKGCDIAPPMMAGDFLRRSVVPNVRRQAQVTGIEPIPEVAEQVKQQIRQLEQQAAQAGLRMRIQGDVGKARLAYSLNGQPVEEWITALTYASGTAGPTYNVATGGMGQTVYYTCGGELIFGLRAPQGELNARDKFFMMVLSTVKVDPQWQARVNQAIGNISAAETKGAADRSKIIAQNGRDISNIISQTYENSSKSHDRAMDGWSQYMRGVETYRNPTTGETVDLSNTYGNAWAGPNGQYILSDSSGFDPNTMQMGNWTRMQQVRR